MKKRLFPLLCALLLLCSLFPLKADAVAVDTSRKCSITVHYTKDGVAFPGLEVSIYRVASASEDGTFHLTGKFSGYPVRIHGITSQTEWDNLASTLLSYIAIDSIPAERTVTTGFSGMAVFSNLKTGLYLVKGVTGENNTGIYTFKDFFLYLPTPNSDGTHNYDVEAKPKCVGFTPKTQYTVTKLWKDSGYTDKRPASVIVDILKDGVIQETVVLNPANNWTYTWYVPDGQGDWTVAEKNPPSGYKVTISEKEFAFTITNTYKTPPTDVPKTGDTFPLIPWILVMGTSGLLLILMGIHLARRKKQ